MVLLPSYIIKIRITINTFSHTKSPSLEKTILVQICHIPVQFLCKCFMVFVVLLPTKMQTIIKKKANATYLFTNSGFI